MNDSLATDSSVPRWYLMVREENVIGGFGLIDNDFMVRTDLCPWLCALYVEPTERGKLLGEQMLTHSRCEASKLGFSKVYLNTDHIGYYEKYDWRYIGDFAHQSGDDARVYEADAIRELEEMSTFFNARADTYDAVHVGHIGGGIESKQIIASFLPDNTQSIIDFGIGTGLELEEIFKRFPDVEVTGLDIAANMLKRLKERYPDKNICLYQESYLNFDFGHCSYDVALSVMTLHHYDHATKTALYRRIHDCIKPNGVYIESDYMLMESEHEDVQALEDHYFSEYERLKKEQGLTDGREYHYDTPCTVANQKKLLLSAGFSSVEVVRQWKNLAIIIARKRG